MKFLILTQYYYPEVGAAQVRLEAFARELIRSGHEVEVVTALPNYPRGKIWPQYGGRLYMREEREGAIVHRTWLFPSMGAGLSRICNYCSFAATSLLAMGKIRRPDWIFVESPPPVLAVAGLYMARSLRVPLIVNIADLWPDAIRELHLVQNNAFLRVAEKLAQFIYDRADYLSVVTDGLRQALVQSKGVASNKITFLPNGVDPDTFRPTAPDEELRRALGLQGKTIVLYGGTLGYAHALEHALHAARRLSSIPRIHFLFVGDGSEKTRLMELAHQLRLSNVSFLDPVPALQMPNYLSISCCGLVSQRNVPLFDANRPAKLFPIMASGKPILLAGKGEGASIVRDAGAGVVVAPEDPEALSEAILYLANDTTLQANMGASGRKYIERRFTWPIIVREWLEQLTKSATQRAAA